MENIDSQPELTSNNLITSLNNWVKERPLRYRSERRVRQNVANAVTTDILHPVETPSLPQKLENYRGNVENGVENTIDRLKNISQKEDRVVGELLKRNDSVTGEEFITQIKRKDEAWISEEITNDGRIISQAVIGDNGELRLTLNFSGSRYEERGANPKIVDSSSFPTGTKVLFLNHAASLGIISWKMK